MPDVIQRDTTVSVLADLRARVAKLETTPPGVCLVSQTGFTASPTYPYESTFTNMTAAAVSFTLTRPQPVLVIPTLSGFYGSGGTASYVTAMCVIVGSLAQQTAALDINGNPMQGSQGYQSNGGSVANHCGPFCNPVPAGNWIAIWQYVMQGGATTTFNYTKAEIDIFTIG
jgi:hypothetical protein